jgi:mitochondrial inner membrane protein COX18
MNALRRQLLGRRPQLNGKHQSIFSPSLHPLQHRRTVVTETILTTTHTIFESIHTVSGAPWAVAIPLSAFIVRAALTSIFTVSAHKYRIATEELTPLNHAIRMQVWDRLNKNMEITVQQRQRLAGKEIQVKMRRLRKQFKIQFWKAFLPLMQFPVLIMAMDTLRRMVGRDGIFFSANVSGEAAKAIETAAITMAQSEASQTKVVGLDDMLDHSEDVQLYFPSFDDALVPLTPSLATEGALWFPNLLLPDPTGFVMPVMLSGTIIANVLVSFRKSHEDPKIKTTISRPTMIISGAFVAGGLVVGLLSVSMPAAMQLYWISSASFSLVQAPVINWLYPRKTRIVIPTKELGWKPDRVARALGKGGGK